MNTCIHTPACAHTSHAHACAGLPARTVALAGVHMHTLVRVKHTCTPGALGLPPSTAAPTFSMLHIHTYEVHVRVAHSCYPTMVHMCTLVRVKHACTPAAQRHLSPCHRATQMLAPGTRVCETHVHTCCMVPATNCCTTPPFSMLQGHADVDAWQPQPHEGGADLQDCEWGSSRYFDAATVVWSHTCRVRLHCACDTCDTANSCLLFEHPLPYSFARQNIGLF